jgi:quinoprotein glucose dehydrogenase
MPILLAVFAAGRAQAGPAEGTAGLVELGDQDPRLKGHYAPKGFKVQIIAAEPTIIDPTGMAFDDRGNLYVSEWKQADHMFDTWETLKLPEGGTTKILRRRKTTTDVVKRLIDRDGDGVCEAAEVVVDGAEMPASIFPWKNSLYLTCIGRLEQWSDEDGDGKFELKTVLADGFCGFFHHWLSGMTLNADGWFYMTAGDNDNHVVGSDGSRVEVSRCGAIFRGRVDGSNIHFFAMGFRNPYRDLAFNSTFDPFLVDNDQEEGSKFQGVRLINPVEEGDYGWRLLPGAPCCVTDFDRGAVNGELPGKLPILAKTGRGAPAGLLIYNGIAFPDSYRDVIIYPDVFRKLVRGYRVKPKGGSYMVTDELTLMTADDDRFRPCHAVVGPDGAIYVLDWRSNSGGAGRLWGDGRFGRLYKLTWEGDGKTPALPLKPNDWSRVLEATDAQLLEMLRGRDYTEARRALRELVTRGAGQRGPLLALLRETPAPRHARLLGLQGARQLWNDEVEAAMVDALDDATAEVRRLAAQALSWEPAEPRPKLVAILINHLNDPDGRVARDVALALGRHGVEQPTLTARALLSWLSSHTEADVVTRDGFIRGLERLGEPGVEAVASLIRSGTPDERAHGVAIFSAFRTAPAARRLPELVQTSGLTGAQRSTLVQQYKDIPLTIPLPTQTLADWVGAHPELEADVKVAALDVCRLAGNPATALVTALLDDSDVNVRLAATRLAAESRPKEALAKLQDRLCDASRSLDERIAIASALRGAGSTAFDALATAYDKFRGEPSFRTEALRAAADADRVRADPLAEAALTDGPPELRAVAIEILGETPQTALKLGQAFLDGKLSRADLPAVLAAVRKYDRAEHRELVGKIEEAVAKGMAALSIDDLKSRVNHGADPWRGLTVYLRDTGARCFTCHRIENQGGSIGPALTGAYQALSLDKLIESMLEPSKEIKEGYEAYKVALKDGRVLSGIKVSQDDKTLVLKDANGQESRIAAGDIDEQIRDTVSMMPVGLVYDLAPDDLADLLCFLLNKSAQETLRTEQRLGRFLAIGPFPPVADDLNLPLDRVDPQRTYTGLHGQPLTWALLESGAGGNVGLRGQLSRDASRAYLSVQIHSDVAQDAAMRFGLEGASRIYLNGTKVADSNTQALTRQPSALVHLPLRAGENTLIVAVDRSPSGGDRGLFSLGTAQPVEVRPAGLGTP